MPAPAPHAGGLPWPPPIRAGGGPGLLEPAIWETLDAYERVFFGEGATLADLDELTAPWRATGLILPRGPAVLDAGVYPDEPELAAALAGAGFAPQEARRTTIRYRSDSELLNVISAVRGRPEPAALAVEFEGPAPRAQWRRVRAGRLNAEPATPRVGVFPPEAGPRCRRCGASVIRPLYEIERVFDHR